MRAIQDLFMRGGASAFITAIAPFAEGFLDKYAVQVLPMRELLFVTAGPLLVASVVRSIFDNLMADLTAAAATSGLIAHFAKLDLRSSLLFTAVTWVFFQAVHSLTIYDPHKECRAKAAREQRQAERLQQMWSTIQEELAAVKKGLSKLSKSATNVAG